MKKCYIAGKIGGLEISDYTKKFQEAKKEVLALGFEPVNPVDLPHNHGRTWNEYMKENIRELLLCDYIYALSNWRHSPGATIEVNLATQVGIHVIHQDTLSNLTK